VDLNPAVDTDLDVNHCDVYRQRCSLRKRGRSAVEGRTIRDRGSDSPRPSVEARVSANEPDISRLMVGRSMRAQRQ
jgi:hypothetical protein